MATHNRSIGNITYDLVTDPDGELIQCLVTGAMGDKVSIRGGELYAIIDTAAVVDPETWSKRFPWDGSTEARIGVNKLLTKLADYAQKRAEDNDKLARRFHKHGVIKTAEQVEAKAEAFREMAATILRERS